LQPIRRRAIDRAPAIPFAGSHVAQRSIGREFRLAWYLFGTRPDNPPPPLRQDIARFSLPGNEIVSADRCASLLSGPHFNNVTPMSPLGHESSGDACQITGVFLLFVLCPCTPWDEGRRPARQPHRSFFPLLTTTRVDTRRWIFFFCGRTSTHQAAPVFLVLVAGYGSFTDYPSISESKRALPSFCLGWAFLRFRRGPRLESRGNRLEADYTLPPSVNPCVRDIALSLNLALPPQAAGCGAVGGWRRLPRVAASRVSSSQRSSSPRGH